MIIFDMDGVIFDTEARFLECWRPVAAEMHLDGIDDVCQECIGIPRTRTLEILTQRFPQVPDMAKLMKEMEDIFDKRAKEEGLPIKYYAPQLLEFLRTRGIPMALATSTVTELAKEELASANLLDYFQVVVGGDMVTHGKPAPDIFLMACEKLGCDPAKAFVIEDSVAGITAAMAAGVNPIMVPDLVSPTDAIKASGIPILPNLEAVKNYLVDSNQL